MYYVSQLKATVQEMYFIVLHVPVAYISLCRLPSKVDQAVKTKYLEGQEITGNMRAILIDWLVQVQIKFRLLQETMYMTVGIIDRFLQVICLTCCPSHPDDKLLPVNYSVAGMSHSPPVGLLADHV